jgi:hypothetical protein
MPSTAVLTAPGKSTVVKTGWFWAKAVPKNIAELIKTVDNLVTVIGYLLVSWLGRRTALFVPSPQLNQVAHGNQFCRASGQGL